MIYTYRKQLLTLFIAIVLIIAGVVVYNVLHAKKEPKTESAPSKSLTVNGLDSTPTPLSDTTKQMIQTYVDAQLTAKHGKGIYTASIRDNSYKRIVTPQGGIVTTLLIDVPSTQETYKFTRTGGDNDQYGTSYVRCAADDQQMVQPSKCKDQSDD